MDKLTAIQSSSVFWS